MSTTETPYGFWPSDWTASQAAAAASEFADLHCAASGVYWVLYEPADARSRLWRWRAGRARCLTPDGFSVRSRVYEYGGTAFCTTEGGVVFVNEADQQLYSLTGCDDDSWSGDGTPPRSRVKALTAGTRRYGDLHYDASTHTVLALEEDDTPAGTQHRVVSIGLPGGVRRVVLEGADFYSSAITSPDGQRLAWIEWDRPQQPWTATRLCVASREPDGGWRTAECVAGAEGGESLQQPRFGADGRLHALSDRLGAWQPWAEQGEGGTWQPAPGPIALADHAGAPWQFGASTFQPLEDGLLAMRFEEGFGRLSKITDGREQRLAEGFTRFRQLCHDATCFYALASGPDSTSAVIAIDRASGAVSVLAGGERPLPPSQVSRPEPLRYRTSDGETAHGFFYAPLNVDHRGPEGERPPLVVFLHGGPTSACHPVFDARIQFWTQRGFAVADLNYRGSSGFGRAYRDALRERWGVTDVADACAVVAHLAERVDPARAFVRGGSAGGYTALCALAFSKVFRAGASLYGVSDPLALAAVTHKFEADYLDWLIGDPERDAERYRERAPLHHADRIEAPVIFFQGGLDAVVVPAQTEAMVAALQARGVPVDYRFYPEERHGFRRADNLADALEREWLFYQRWL
ncbi:alpha/beta hydrolase family protein [Stutzerimonas urumqiensis]|uniref:alpha/beta hydrolase family protein n=1 Tax=Stutzerimonas urumqiensis TaxID=638269 RepID=UPI000EAE7E33|nr:S9 family peptidase [Stutzerimonas urumqiensis]